MIEYIYWSGEDSFITKETYISFLCAYYGEKWQFHFDRLQWYIPRNNDFRILLAVENNSIVGQSCAYRCNAVICGEKKEWWWSVDTLVLPTMRGRGVGKKLQGKLHKDLNNFSSVWYSPTNGHIKRLCGANSLSIIHFNYFPINSYFSTLFQIYLKKKFKKDIAIPTFLKWKYLFLNSSNLKSYSFKELDLLKDIDSIVKFYNENLQKYDFYIERSSEYLIWKYSQNPNLSFKMFGVYQTGKMVALIAFSFPFEKTYLGVNKKVVTLLDFIIKEKSFTLKKALSYIGIYYKDKGEALDAILCLDDANYYPYFRYPFQGTKLLSTCNYSSRKPYLSYIDQDMEQMM